MIGDHVTLSPVLNALFPLLELRENLVHTSLQVAVVEHFGVLVSLLIAPKRIPAKILIARGTVHQRALGAALQELVGKLLLQTSLAESVQTLGASAGFSEIPITELAHQELVQICDLELRHLTVFLCLQATWLKTFGSSSRV